MSGLSRRHFLFSAAGAALAARLAQSAGVSGKGPNIILCMADDMGWGDPAYNGHPRIKTPNLDAMSKEGVRFDRWYSGAPVCSPTRGACMTGRHPYRYGIFGANKGHMPPEECTLAEALKPLGYATGHFGKWHLGTLTKKTVESNRGGPRGIAHYSPPWENGFDECFATEAKVPTYNPMITPANWPGKKEGEPFGTYYWTGPEERVTENLEGDDSRLIMDRALPFIRRAVEKDQPFLSVIWFHAPHLPAVAGPEHRKPYADLPEEAQHYMGCITALDEQMGRLRRELKELGVAENTMLWFCSDNGPAGKEDSPVNGSAGPFRGRKGYLYEGGIRVPGMLIWPEAVPEAISTSVPCCNVDLYPTIMEALGGHTPAAPEPRDGISLMPLLRGGNKARNKALGFEHREQRALIEDQWKLISMDAGKTWELYDLVEDPGEKQSRAADYPDRVESMKKVLEGWRESCRESRHGADYPEKGSDS